MWLYKLYGNFEWWDRNAEGAEAPEGYLHQFTFGSPGEKIYSGAGELLATLAR